MTTASPPSSQAQLLDDLASQVSAVSSPGEPLQVIFDLDDTLLSTSRRHLRILREYVLQDGVAARYPGEARRLLRLEEAELRYGIVDTVRAAGISHDELLRDLREFWFDRFFKNDYLSADEPIAGAAAYCQELADRGACLVYMTGRDESMRGGTEISLARHGFPLLGERARLVLKPRFDYPDLEFKTEALRELASHGPVLAAFENEPAHINMFQEAFPSALMVLIETRHSGKPVVPHHCVRRIRDFLR